MVAKPSSLPPNKNMSIWVNGSRQQGSFGPRSVASAYTKYLELNAKHMDARVELRVNDYPVLVSEAGTGEIEETIYSRSFGFALDDRLDGVHRLTNRLPAATFVEIERVAGKYNVNAFLHDAVVEKLLRSIERGAKPASQ